MLPTESINLTETQVDLLKTIIYNELENREGSQKENLEEILLNLKIMKSLFLKKAVNNL
jgi:peptide deformylase